MLPPMGGAPTRTLPERLRALPSFLRSAAPPERSASRHTRRASLGVGLGLGLRLGLGLGLGLGRASFRCAICAFLLLSSA